MTIADEARDNALHCEMVKYAYRQTRDGVVVSFVVHPNDIPPELSISHIGARYMVALVQIGDDELPIKPRKEAMPNTSRSLEPHNAPPQPDSPRSAGAKRPWEDFQPAQQAGIRSNDVRFEQFLEEEYPAQWRELQDAAECIRSICGVHSRAELGTDHAKRVIWHQLDKHFQAWDARVRMNA